VSKILFTKVISKTPLTKKFFIDDGVLKSKASGHLVAGSFETIELHFEELDSFFKTLKSNESILLGTCILKKDGCIKPASEISKYSDCVARTLKYFNWQMNKGLLVFDFDKVEYPPEEGLNELYKILQFKFKAYIRPSVSDGIALENSKDKVIEDYKRYSYHIYTIYNGDPSNFRLFMKARCINTGNFGIHVSKIGSILVRTIVDTAVLSPERLIYEAPPIINEKDKDKIIVNKPESFYINSEYSAYTINTDELKYESSRASLAVAKAKSPLLPDIIAKQEKYTRDEAKKLSEEEDISFFEAKDLIKLR